MANRNQSFGAGHIRLYLFALALCMLAVGTVFAWWMSARTDRDLRANLLQQARMVSEAVDVEQVKALTGTEADLESPNYLRLKERLAAVNSANPQGRFVYLMGRRADGAVFFFVDSEPVGSEDESPAGQIYEEVSAGTLWVFDTQTEMVEGPIGDRWGDWVSVLVPLTDPKNGKMVALLGMDIDARLWKWEVAARVGLPVGLVLILGLLVLIIIILMQSRRQILVQREMLQESEERFRNIVDTASDLVWKVDEHAVYVYASPRVRDILGYEPEEVQGKTPFDFMPAEERERVAELFRKSAGKQEPFSFLENISIHKDGHRVILESSGVPIVGNDGTFQGYFGTNRDITGRRQAEEQIRKLNEGLEIKVQERTRQLLEAQDELVRKEKLSVLGRVAGSVGHELRNPLGVMSNAVYFLQTVLSDADETTREYLNIIKDEIEISNRIVSDLLDSVRSKPPHPETVGVREVIERTVHQLTIPDSVSVRLDIPEALPALRVDAMQIKQVFSNLISNGVEAMPGGGALEIRAVQNGPDGTVTVSVRDSGSGMTPELLGKLFQPLFTTKARGIGLGLVVVKNLTEVNGGTVNVESEVGKGTVFTVTLPRNSSTPGAA